MITPAKELYAEKLVDPRWITRADEIKALDGYACILCGRKKGLEVHHLRYGSKGLMMEPWDYPADSLVTLCRDHHKAMHDPTMQLQAENLLVAMVRRLKLTPLEILELPAVIAAHKTSLQIRVEERNGRIRNPTHATEAGE